MFALAEGVKIYLYASPIDMRGSIDSLTQHVVKLLTKSPQSGDVYLFYNRGKDKLKALYWDGNGFILCYKRMERRRFILSKLLSGEINLTYDECALLFQGFDFMIKREQLALPFSHYF